MTKIELQEFLKTNYFNEINLSNRNCNVRYAKKNKNKNVFWINIAMDKRVEKTMFFILNYIEKNKAIYLKIPPFTINKENSFRIKNSNGRLSYDIELSSNEEDFLIDVKSGGTSFNFKPFVIEELTYEKFDN